MIVNIDAYCIAKIIKIEIHNPPNSLNPHPNSIGIQNPMYKVEKQAVLNDLLNTINDVFHRCIKCN